VNLLTTHTGCHTNRRRRRISSAQDALDNDPFIMARPEWIAAIEQLLAMGTAGIRQMGTQLRDQRIPTEEARGCERFSTLD
jgi:hypothetical protein